MINGALDALHGEREGFYDGCRSEPSTSWVLLEEIQF